MSLVTLGPDGTYSAYAARLYDPKAHIELAPTIREVSRVVAGSKSKKGLLPLENSIQGIVAESLDSLFEYGLTIEDELILDIHHSLFALAEAHNISRNSINTIYSHPQALGQCRDYLSKHYPKARLVAVSSTMEGVQLLIEKQNLRALAIAPAYASEVEGIQVVDENIEDSTSNQTKFITCSSKSSKKQLPFVLIAVVPKEDRPGLLFEILKVLKDLNINMTQIESRPRRDRPGFYMFYMRLQMNGNDERYEAIAKGMKDLGVLVRRMSA